MSVTMLALANTKHLVLVFDIFVNGHILLLEPAATFFNALAK